MCRPVATATAFAPPSVTYSTDYTVKLGGVTVEAQGPLDPANPYPISFKIADANFIPLTNVNAYLVICYLAAAPAPPAQQCEPPYKTRLFKAGWRDHALAADQQFSVTLDDFMRFTAPATFGDADISIIVEYQLWWLPVRQEKLGASSAPKGYGALSCHSRMRAARSRCEHFAAG